MSQIFILYEELNAAAVKVILFTVSTKTVSDGKYLQAGLNSSLNFIRVSITFIIMTAIY